MATQVTPETYTQKILFTGTQAAIDAAEKSTSGLYFASDTHKIFKGSEDFSQAARVVTAVPASPAKNALYVVVDNEGAFVKAVAVDASGNQKEISWAKATSVGSSSTDATVATAKAVYDYVQSVVGGDTVVVGVAAGTNAGDLVISKGSGATSTVTVPGVATIPTWDAQSRTLTIPYTGVGGTVAGSVVAAIGKDMVVTSGRYNATNETIEMWISTQDPDTDDPAIVIPVGDLVDEISGGTTDTAITTYTTSSNTLTADVRVSAKSGNYLTVVTGDSTAANNGLMVDLTSVNAAIADNATDIATLNTNIAALETALTTWTTLS